MLKPRPAVVGLLLTFATLVGTFAPARAQDQPVRFDGRVQWIAGELMVVQLDNGASVSVDLDRVPQDEYAALSPSERVVVIGTLPYGARRIVGSSIRRGGETEAP
jgi:hypothetical protein